MIPANDTNTTNRIAFTKKLEILSHQSMSRRKHFNLPKDEGIIEVIEYLNSLDLKQENTSKMSRKESKDINVEFFNNYVQIQKVLYDFGKYADYIDPLEIKPIYNLKKDGGIMETNLGKYPEICISKIELSKYSTGNLAGIYAHELVHTQLETHPSQLYHDFFLREALSIFIEKVVTYELSPKNMENIKYMRLKYLKKALDLYEMNVWSSKKLKSDELARSYIVSTLEAEHLFYIYANSSEKQKDNILKIVTNIFKREDYVDRLFSSRKVNYTNSKTLKYIK